MGYGEEDKKEENGRTWLSNGINDIGNLSISWLISFFSMILVERKWQRNKGKVFWYLYLTENKILLI